MNKLGPPLPGLLGMIAEATDEATALRIAAAVGGTRVDIPANPPAHGHWLVELVGRNAADRICAHLRTLGAEGRAQGVPRAIVPRGPMGLVAQARRKLAQELAAGASVRQAALLSGLTERTGWRIKRQLKRRATGGDQGELF